MKLNDYIVSNFPLFGKNANNEFIYIPEFSC